MPAVGVLLCPRCMCEGRSVSRNKEQRDLRYTERKRQRAKWNRLRARCFRWVWSWLHIRGLLKHLGVRCLPPLPAFNCTSQRPQYPFTTRYFGWSTDSTFTQKIKAWLTHSRVPLAICFYHFLSSSVISLHSEAAKKTSLKCSVELQVCSESSVWQYSGFKAEEECLNILFGLFVYMPPYLIPSGTRVSLFPPSVEAKATMVWSSKSRSSFCPHFHSLCPAGLRFCCGIWQRFPFVHKWHQASDCDIQENEKGSILLIMCWMTSISENGEENTLNWMQSDPKQK